MQSAFSQGLVLAHMSFVTSLPKSMWRYGSNLLPRDNERIVVFGPGSVVISSPVFEGGSS